MKYELLNHLCCPCGGALKVHALEQTMRGPHAEILSGSLTCEGCAEEFPIIRGVPRMLTGELRQVLQEEYPEYFAQQRGTQESARSGQDAQLATMRSFGYEWRHFNDIRPEGSKNFDIYFEGIDLARERFPLALDLGCGKGRHLFHLAPKVRTAIGVDLSCAVDAAFDNTRDHDNVHIVQADLYNLPLRERSFDLAYSLGVLHHLPDPEGGFRRLLSLVKPGGQVLVYLYWALEGEPRWKRGLLQAVGGVRKVTTRMPFPMLRAFSFTVALAAFITFVLPYKIASRTPLRAWAERLPLKTYAGFPFRCLYQDQFDRLSAPVENRYTRAEVEAWFQRAGLEDVAILGEVGWRARGRTPVGVTCG